MLQFDFLYGFREYFLAFLLVFPRYLRKRFIVVLFHCIREPFSQFLVRHTVLDSVACHNNKLAVFDFNGGHVGQGYDQLFVCLKLSVQLLREVPEGPAQIQVGVHSVVRHESACLLYASLLQRVVGFVVPRERHGFSILKECHGPRVTCVGQLHLAVFDEAHVGRATPAEGDGHLGDAVSLSGFEFGVLVHDVLGGEELWHLVVLVEDLLLNQNGEVNHFVFVQGDVLVEVDPLGLGELVLEA